MSVRCTVYEKDITEPFLIGRELVKEVAHDGANLQNNVSEWSSGKPQLVT
jgi:hypothetical protein